MAKKMCLRPCYVCGRHPDVRCIGSSWYVKCECGQQILPSDYHAKNEVVAIWNYIQKNNAAVVRELEKLAKLHARHQLKCEAKGMDYCADRHEHKIQALDEAIEIVKRGGTDGN